MTPIPEYLVPLTHYLHSDSLASHTVAADESSAAREPLGVQLPLPLAASAVQQHEEK